MKPGMILTNYRIMDNYNEDSPIYPEDILSLKKDAEDESLKIINLAKQEHSNIISQANSILSDTLNLKTSIENNYLEFLKKQFTINLDSFFSQRELEYKNLLTNINTNFDNSLSTIQHEVKEIILNTISSILGEEYNNPDRISSIVANHFSGFEESKNNELILSKDLIDNCDLDTKSLFEDKLKTSIDSIKFDSNLNGFILHTDLGSIECNLDNQINLIQKALESSI